MAIDLSFEGVSQDPGECRQALTRASFAVVDLETTGLGFTNAIVSAAVLTDSGMVYLLPVRSCHASIRNIEIGEFKDALSPLAREDLIIVGHNLTFDLGKLAVEGIRYGNKIHDTMRLLRLLDSDRGAERGEDRHPPRRRRTNNDALNYRLKPAVENILGVKMLDFPGRAQDLPLRELCRYSISDVVGTRELYRYVWDKLPWASRDYYKRLIAPVIPQLVGMTTTGVSIDTDFIDEESAKLLEIMARLSATHDKEYEVRLDQGDEKLRCWLYQTLELPVPNWVRRGRKYAPSVAIKALQKVSNSTTNDTVKNSIRLIIDYAVVRDQMRRLRSLTKYVHYDGRIHASFEDRQPAGRVTCTKPNLQAMSKGKEVAGVTIRTRSALVASSGHTLVRFDLAQADVAHSHTLSIGFH